MLLDINLAGAAQSFFDLAQQIKTDLWGDAFVAAIIGVMWNLQITVLAPGIPPQHLYHSGRHPDIVLVYNGANHYLATGEFLLKKKKN